MANYTELILNCEFDRETPSDVIKSLRCLLGEVDTPNHRCVENEHLAFGLLDNNNYASLNSESVLRLESAGETHYLSVHANIKDNYDEIDRFLAWIAPYSRRDGFVGYKYVPLLEKPTLIFFEKGKAFLVEIAFGEKIELSFKES